MFIVCGEALFDVFINDSVPLHATSVPFEAKVGGSPFNVAIGLSRLGNNAALVTGVSTDLLGDRLINVLDAENVSTQFVSRKQAPTTLGFVQHNRNGAPDYVFYGEGAADRSVELGDVEKDFSAARCLHFGSYSIVVPPTADSFYALAAREAGKRIISLDPNIRPTVEEDLEIWRSRIQKFIEFVDVIKLSDEDMSLLYPDKQPDDVLDQWLSQGVKLAVLTRGSDGATLLSVKDRVNVSSPKTDVVDTVGAGDTFQALLLDRLVELDMNDQGRWDEQLDADCLHAIGSLAATAASITCSRVGADLPTRQEIETTVSKTRTRVG
ncbi:MAG: carbohydrate kinase [Gammaproteobacteria bacterium]|nr:carbohydrate kinase [Gammaproteobacteria bacterium]